MSTTPSNQSPFGSFAEGATLPGLDHWRTLPRADPPGWTDQRAADDVFATIARLPPVVSVREVYDLQSQLARVCRGEAFLLQGGDSLETFIDSTEEHVSMNWRLMFQAAVVLTFASGLPVVKLARAAGQYARVRPAPTDALGLPAYAGDMINSLDADPELRLADLGRVHRGYLSAVATMNLLRMYDESIDLGAIGQQIQSFARGSPASDRYGILAREIGQAIQFMRAWGATADDRVRVFSSHEAVVLEYERALCRQFTGNAYGLSAHSVWLSEQLRQMDGAHIAYVSRIANPIAIQLGPNDDAEMAADLCALLNGARVPGRLTLAISMGNDKIRDLLPPIVERVHKKGHVVVWQCAPMEVNIHESSTGYRTVHFDRIVDEVLGFFEVHQSLGTVPGGVHLNMTGENVTECLGGAAALEDANLPERYETASAPRLNADQTLEIAFLIGEMLRG